MSDPPAFHDVIVAFLRWLAGVLARYTPPRRPAPFGFTSEQVLTNMASEFLVGLTMPARPEPNDIVAQELTVTVDGAAQPPIAVDLAAPSVPLGQFAPGHVLTASLVYADAAGNRSEPRVETLTVSDTVAPPEPGDFGFTSEQVFVPDAP